MDMKRKEGYKKSAGARIAAIAGRMWVAAAALWLAGSARAQQTAIIPQPVEMETVGTTWTLPATLTVGTTDKALGHAATYLADALTQQTGRKVRTGSKKGDIRLGLDRSLGSGAYRLSVGAKGATIEGGDYAGVVNGIATLRQLMPAAPDTGATVAGVKVSDAPQFGWRGFMIDCSRHFYTVGEIERVLDMMAYYKMNRFHWHLTDDQGWRIEIKRYPALTLKGGWRRLNGQDSLCLKRAEQEDMPNLLLPEEKMRTADDGSREYGGYYTQDDVRRVVAYAAERGIDVIPELDMPGHSLAAIQCVGGLSCSEDTRWGRLFSTPMCPGKDTMLEFCKNVWTEVFGLFPYEYVHIGGDEVDMKNWRACADCQRRMKDNGLSSEPQLQTWFNHYMEDFFRAHGRKMIAWDDVIDGGLSPYTTVMWWRSWLPKGPKRATSHGNDLIDVPVSYFYLSGRDDPSKMEGIYRFDPYATLNAEESQHVRGIHSCLWGERIASAERMWYQLFPRFMAVAERAWSRPERMDYEDFSRRMLKHLPRLEAMGIQYRLPDVTGLIRTAVFTDSDTVSVACIDPSVSIHYTTDGTMPQVSSAKYTGPIAVSQTTHFIFRPFGADGRKGDAVSTSLVKTTMAEAVGVDGELLPGLRNVWYDYGGDNCAGIEKAQIKGEYVTDGVVIPCEARENIGLVITGYIEVPHDGIYSFALYSDDGSQLIIDDKMVVDSDGMHDIMEVTGQHAMKAGLHPLRATYFDHNGGDLRLTVKDKHGKKVEVKYWHK